MPGRGMGMSPKTDVVIGGGLGGLASAALLARAGRKVVLFEKASAPGGRAATHDEDGIRFNLGPHALYRRGAARSLLRELGVDPTGARPPVSGSLALRGGRLHALPVGFASILSTSLLGLGEKIEAARALRGLAELDPAALRGKSTTEWIEGTARRTGSRELLHALVRVTSYANAPDLVAADETVRQLQLGLSTGVMYVHGGWQTIADALRERAVESGAEIRTATRVTAVAPGRVELAGGTALAARAVIIAASPAAARSLLPASAALAAAERDAVPVRAACLDLALSSLPRPRAVFCLGIDEPLYYSVHSASARLAPGETQVIHVARYLAPGETADASSLEALVGRLQPGWRDRVVARRFLPQLVVANDVFPLGRRRPSTRVADAPGVFLVGDWIGEGAMLADASLASARSAVAAVLEADQRSPREASPARRMAAAASAARSGGE
jgi:phytoene dehydrogenase-like protein